MTFKSTKSSSTERKVNRPQLKRFGWQDKGTDHYKQTMLPRRGMQSPLPRAVPDWTDLSFRDGLGVVSPERENLWKLLPSWELYGPDHQQQPNWELPPLFLPWEKGAPLNRSLAWSESSGPGYSQEKLPRPDSLLWQRTGHCSSACATKAGSSCLLPMSTWTICTAESSLSQQPS